MERNIVRKILAAYGVNHNDVLPPQKGYRNTSYPITTTQGTINAILYKSEPGILPKIYNANRVGNFLASSGLPARRTFDPRVIQLKAGQRVKYACLYTYLPGHTIPWEAYTKDHIKNLGASMSAMHAALAACDVTGLPSVVDEQQAVHDRMHRYFSDANVLRALRSKLNLHLIPTDYTRLLGLCRSLPAQTLHMDFVRSNILFNGKAISGIIDFEKTAAGHPIFDVARTLAFLLVDCKYKEETKIRKYFLQSGYTKRGMVHLQKISVGGQDLLELLVDFFLLHDFYKFLRHNPYEALPENEHFIRTKDLLIQRRRLTESR
jgi:Ser/Thr protein kinase RdoA (MazF antagonist)